MFPQVIRTAVDFVSSLLRIQDAYTMAYYNFCIKFSYVLRNKMPDDIFCNVMV
jgi:hypothetical protein